MITNLMAPAARAARTIGALAAALTLAILLAQAAAAEGPTMGQQANTAMATCERYGGAAKFDYTYNKDGTFSSITVTCLKGGGSLWKCVYVPTGKPTCTTPFIPEESPEYPGGGTNAPAPVEDPRTEGDIVIIGTGTYAQDGSQPTNGWYDETIDYTDGSQPTVTTAAPVDTVEDYGPTTDDPVEPEVVAEDEEVTTFEYRNTRGGDEEQP